MKLECDVYNTKATISALIEIIGVENGAAGAAVAVPIVWLVAGGRGF